ncbi:MAG: nucleotide sugar dehydrogenase [Chloroflexi bacterium]|nr:nucleotide sugar dehydrogenase [Chloroflexota bacterium]
MESNSDIRSRIDDKTARVAVIGLGYVGLPLAIELARAGYPVAGLDLDRRKVESLEQGTSYIPDVASADVKRLVETKQFLPTRDYEVLRSAHIVFICVPTPFDKMKAPDLNAVISATRGIAERLQRGQLVILQSTTYPGTTEEVCLPILEESGLKAGEDFHLAFSPERIDPGATSSAGWNVKNTPKVLGGLTPQCTELARALLTHLTPEVHVVSSPRAAEMCKLLENIFRSVNIALVNELALLSERMGIDFWEVIGAAKTKPFGFMPFYPGAGVGGHCIPVDPYYLSWKAREYDFFTRFIELAADINEGMPFHVVGLVNEALGKVCKPLQGARVLVLGVAFKHDVDDARNSPAERVIELLVERGAQVRYHDPYVPTFRVGGNVFHRPSVELNSVDLTPEVLRQSDAVVIVTPHSNVDYAAVVAHAPLVVDSANATRDFGPTERIIRLGSPHGPASRPRSA